MTHADFIHASCLMIGNEELWTIEKIETFFREKKKKSLPNKVQTTSNDNNSNNPTTENTISLQASMLKIHERLMNLEATVQQIQASLQ